jgi:hypothetical protein
MCTTFWLENLKGRDILKDLGLDVDHTKKYLKEIWLGRME